MTGFSIVTTTLSDADAARAMARALVEAKLAACVQITPIESVFSWNGGIEDSREHLIACKVATEDFAAIEAAIRARHDYDVPEIVMTPIIAGHRPYLDWLAASTAR